MDESSGGIHDAVKSIVTRDPESATRPMTGIKIKYQTPQEYKSNWLDRLGKIRKDSSHVKLRVQYFDEMEVANKLPSSKVHEETEFSL